MLGVLELGTAFRGHWLSGKLVAPDLICVRQASIATWSAPRLKGGFETEPLCNRWKLSRQKTCGQWRGFSCTAQSYAGSTLKWTPFKPDATKVTSVDMPKFYDHTHFKGPVPRNKIDESFARSGGPGGQHVNKVSSKVILSFHVESADWLPKWVRYRLLDTAKNKVSKDGVLRITSDVCRTQSQNVKDAYAKLEELIEKASELPKGPTVDTQIRVQRYEHRAKMHRLGDKKFQSGKRKERNFIE